MKVSEVEENDRGTRVPRMGKDIPLPSFLVSHPLGTENSEMTNKILYVNCLHKDDPHHFLKFRVFYLFACFHAGSCVSLCVPV